MTEPDPLVALQGENARLIELLRMWEKRQHPHHFYAKGRL